MAIKPSGPLSMTEIVAEFGGTAPHALSEYYGKAAGIPSSGVIKFSDFYGKSSIFTLNISSNSVAPNIRTLATNAGWDQSAKLIVNITAPLINRIALGSSSFPGGVEINIASGTRIGSDGNTAAFSTSVPVTVSNNGVISGVGGNGGRGQEFYYNDGGVKYVNGGIGGSGQRFASNTTTVVAAQPGSAGQVVTFGDWTPGPWARGGAGGNGGGWGAGGSAGLNGVDSSGGIIQGSFAAQPGFGAGAAVSGNSFITWAPMGSIAGGIS